MYTVSKSLETERLTVRWWKMRDLAAIRKHASNPLVAEMAGWSPVTGWIEAWERIVIGYPRPYCYAIVDKETNRAIGSVSFMDKESSHLPLQKHELEIGYWVAQEYWGQGIAAEAAGAAIGEMFEHGGVQRIYIVIDKTNGQSLRVQGKLVVVYNRTEYIELGSKNERTSCYVGVLEYSDWRNQQV